MKKIIIALAILASAAQIAGAQQKELAAAKKAVDAALATTGNAKKAANPAVWIKLGQAYLNEFTAAQGSGWIGANEQELSLIMREQPVAVKQAVLQGRPYSIKSFGTADYYFGPDGRLMAIKPTDGDAVAALGKALEAFAKAGELDAAGKKAKDITEGIKLVNQKFNDLGYTEYTTGNPKAASEAYEQAAKALATAPVSQVDTNALYNTGLAAWIVAEGEPEGDARTSYFQRAAKFFNLSKDNGYFGEAGEVYAKLSDIAAKLGDKDASFKYLEDGAKMFPGSQSILVGLINHYVASGDNPQKVFELLDRAKVNEPNNASLYYVEGNILLQLGEDERAMAAYDKCSEIDPNYEYGYIGKGVALYNRAVDLQDKAAKEMDNDKYQKLAAEFESSLKGCIEPFEKAFEVTRDEGVKHSICQYLKNACFRFREEGDYQAKYDKYNGYLNQ